MGNICRHEVNCRATTQDEEVRESEWDESAE
jgi:hypothetical protein